VLTYQRLVRLEVDYRLASTVCDVNVSPSVETNWGENDLESDAPLEPGDRTTFIVPAGMYDLRLLDCDGVEVFESYDEAIERDTTLAIP
jgi:hypothetical protein